MRLLYCQDNATTNAILVIFSVLETLLWYLCSDFIPRRDVGAGLLAVTVLLVLPSNMVLVQRKTLQPNERFHKLFVLLSTFEVVVTLVAPWYYIRHSYDDGNSMRYQLAPHLFVFQGQIVLETLVMSQKDDTAIVMFWYTVVANTYRATALVTWVQRVFFDFETKSGDQSIISYLCIPTTILPVLAVLIWCYSNYFIIFEWYPRLMPKSEQPKQTTIVPSDGTTKTKTQ